MPNSIHAGMYGAILHYLKAVAGLGRDDPQAILPRMRATPIDDFMTHGGSIREDGRVIRDIYVFRVKTPAESVGAWDLYRVVAKIPGEAAAPLNEGDCSLVGK